MFENLGAVEVDPATLGMAQMTKASVELSEVRFPIEPGRDEVFYILTAKGQGDLAARRGGPIVAKGRDRAAVAKVAAEAGLSFA